MMHSGVLFGFSHPPIEQEKMHDVHSMKLLGLDRTMSFLSSALTSSGTITPPGFSAA